MSNRARIATKLPSKKAKSPYPDGLNPLAIIIPEENVNTARSALATTETINLVLIAVIFNVIFWQGQLHLSFLNV